MQIITQIDTLQILGKSAVAIGKFDGIHLGHQKLLQEIIAKKKEGMKAVVFTFYPSPSAFFSGKKEKELTTLEEKRQCFEKMGVDILVEFPFNKETASTTREVFVEEILVKKLHAGYIVAGSDLSFARKGEGNSTYLVERSKEFDFSVQIVDKITFEQEIISSTAIRQAVLLGDVKKAAGMLGRKYSISGTVKKGKQIGRTIGFPTLNISLPEDKLSLQNGVYKTKVFVKETWYDAITNVGCRPTVTDNPQIFVESYLYDFDGILYGEKIEVYFVEFMRKEMKFDSLSGLKEQLQKDLEAGRKIRSEV